MGKVALRRYTNELGGRYKKLDVEIGPVLSCSERLRAKVFGLNTKDGQGLLMVQYAHFSDVLSLTLLLKSIRWNIIQRKGFELKVLRRDSCVNGTKSDCWGCGNQICESCKFERRIHNPETTKHTEQCTAICSKCYYKHLRDSTPSFPSKPGLTCSHLSRGRSPLNVREICSLCNAGTNDQIQSSRQRKELAELNHLEAMKVFCTFCQTKMENGPRWWVCSVCGEECKSRLHSQWVSNK